MPAAAEDSPRDGHEVAPKVSVTVPVYQGERFLQEALDSLLAQTFQDFELILVDDGSTDRSLEICEAYAGSDARVRLVRHDRNLGIVQARNTALAAAHPSSTYVAVMDSDDVAAPQRLARQVAYLDVHPRCAAVGGHNEIIDEASRVVGRRRYPTSDREICAVMTRFDPISHPTAMIRRAAWEAVGLGYAPDCPRAQDYELFLRLGARFELANLDDFLLKYRVQATQGKRTHLKETLRVTLKLQLRWMGHPRYRSAVNPLLWCAQAALLAVPDPCIMAAFKRLRYEPA